MDYSTDDFVRTFFAIDLSEQVKAHIALLIADMANIFDATTARWVKPHTLHITLQSLKKVNRHDIPNICYEVEKTLKLIRPFTLELGPVQLFPTVRKPQVIILDIAPQDMLADLAHAIGKGIIKAGYTLEQRPFRGHVTIGRFNINTKQQGVFLPKIPILEIPKPQIEDVIFFRSDRGNSPDNDYLILEKFFLE